jgi:hypothetical protein
VDTGVPPEEEFAENALRVVIARYEEAKEAALRERDVRLRAFHEAGWRTTDLQRVTGYSRETIRLALDPQARASVNAVRRDATSVRRQAPWVLPRTLGELHGPTEGIVTLPRDLIDAEDPDDRTYDLSLPVSLPLMYKDVLHRAKSVEHLRAWIDGALLVEQWPYIHLLGRLKELWERRFPELARRAW